MAIRLKVAKTEKEVDDALWVRHEVFVVEDGKFGGKPLPSERIVDRYDTFPGVYNIIVYEEEQPVATMRLVKESAIGLPAYEHYDFSNYRDSVARERMSRELPGAPVFGSAGMLAVRNEWRARRDVVRAMFKVAAGVSLSAGATHIVVVVNHETARMYRRLGFDALSERFWVDSVGNYVVPLASSVESFHTWAFGDLPQTPLDTFKDSFERVFVRPGELIFAEGELGSHAYIVDNGSVRIFRTSPEGEQLDLAHLTRGSLFGELALIDSAPRSAGAMAMSDVELISLDRASFLEQLYSEAKRVHELLQLFTQRIRRMDEFAMVLAFQPAAQRLGFALDLVRKHSTPDPKDPSVSLFRGGADEIAQSAAVDKETAQAYLDELRERGEIDYNGRHIRFLA